MKQPIKKSDLIICEGYGNKFHEDVKGAIDIFQSEGLEVELQYQFSNGIFTVFIVGRG